MGGNYREVYHPGVYEIIIQTFSTQGVGKSSKQADSYKVGEYVQVVQVVEYATESRVRGRMQDGTWISLKAMDTGKRFVSPCEPGTVEVIDLNTLPRQTLAVQIYVTDDSWIERTTWVYKQHGEETFGPLGHARYNQWQVPKGEYIKSINVCTKTHKGREKCHGIMFVTDKDNCSEWFGSQDGEILSYGVEDGDLVCGVKLDQSPICPKIVGVVTAGELVAIRENEKRNMLNTHREEGPVGCEKGCEMVSVLVTPMNQETARCSKCGDLPTLFTNSMACPDCIVYFCSKHTFKTK